MGILSVVSLVPHHLHYLIAYSFYNFLGGSLPVMIPGVGELSPTPTPFPA